ncbi:MAG: HK97 family phage prohead protease [Rhodospirillales bacterium]
MLYGSACGALEIRRLSTGATSLRGSFPYNRTAILSDGGKSGRPRKERFASNAFNYSVLDPTRDIHLLVGHDYAKPLASKLTRSLTLKDSKEALTFDATIAPEVVETSYGQNAIALLTVGLAVGLLPGFRIPPVRAVQDAETITQEEVDPENDMHGAIIRTVNEAILYELSIVTSPAYEDATVELRSWSPSPVIKPQPVLARWRL